MPTKQSFFLPLACFLLGVGESAFGLGLRGPGPSVVLGQPLDLQIILQLDEGETVEPACVRGSVTLGERVLAPAAVQTSLEEAGGGRRAVRLRTLVRVEEPVVEVEVGVATGVGCAASLSRRFVLFADPPTVAPAPPVLAAVAPARSLEPSAPRPVRAQEEERSAAQAGGTVAAPSTEAGPKTRRSDARVALTAAADTAPGRAASTRTRRADAATEAATEAVVKPSSVAKPAAARTAAARTGPVARLRLDSPSAPAAVGRPDELSEQALAAVDEANRAVLAAIAAASASQARMQALEASVARLREEAQAQAALTQQLRARAAQAEGRGDWATLLGVVVVGLLALTAWLWLRVRQIERLRRQAWLEVAQPSGQAPQQVDAVAPPPVLHERGMHRGRVAAVAGGLAPPAPEDTSRWQDDPVEPALTPGQDPEPETMRTQPLVPPLTPRSGPAARGMSAEELIDLEQQVDFFAVLGQEDAAIELLAGHLRDSGGASPLPYLKLMDIYHRRGDEDAYRRIRDRFNQRFNARAPGWHEAGDGRGRSLEDYPDVVARLQRDWRHPVEAMTTLEVLLFRHDDGQLFELPAYRELLFLYTLARDLAGADPSAGVGLGVDVLLPLDAATMSEPAAAASRGQGPTTTPGVLMADPPGSLRPHADAAHAATAPVDLDLSEPSDSALGRLR